MGDREMLRKGGDCACVSYLICEAGEGNFIFPIPQSLFAIDGYFQSSALFRH